MFFDEGMNLFAMNPVPNDEIPKTIPINVVSKINPPYTATPAVLIMMGIRIILFMAIRIWPPITTTLSLMNDLYKLKSNYLSGII